MSWAIFGAGIRWSRGPRAKLERQMRWPGRSSAGAGRWRAGAPLGVAEARRLRARAKDVGGCNLPASQYPYGAPVIGGHGGFFREPVGVCRTPAPDMKCPGYESGHRINPVF